MSRLKKTTADTGYMENGFMVFTERFHAARGSCCGNACRHCPYDHEAVSDKA